MKTLPEPRKAFFIGVDSDGCAFDAMEIKHKECFTPATIRCWGLQAVSRYARETAEFVNLYSRWRGGNRWPSLVRVLDLLAQREEVKERGFSVPATDRLKEFLASGRPQSDAGLRQWAGAHPHADFDRALGWSQAVNDAIAAMVHGVPPFPFVGDCLVAMKNQADLMVVSATPVEALEREWSEHGLAAHMGLIAGQELGSKQQHLELMAGGRYAKDHVLLVGDAPADRDAAHAAGALFYPINPGAEAASWKRLRDEAAGKFFAGTYAGAYEADLITAFEKLLPETPPWQVSAQEAKRSTVC